MRIGKTLWKGALSGAIAGLVASWTMNQFQAGWSRIKKRQSSGNEQAESEDATMKAANLISKKILHHQLSREDEKKTAPHIHYGFGTILGTVYGVMAEEFPSATAGFGTAYATLVFLVVDEGAVSTLGLGAKPNEVPLSSHAYALASHLVYGVSTESVRRGVRTALGRDTWKSQLEKTLRSNAKALKSNVRKTKDTVAHWEVEQRTELPKKVAHLQKAARRKWTAAA